VLAPIGDRVCAPPSLAHTPADTVFLMLLQDIAPWAALVVVLVVLLWVDLHFFARGREPDFRESVIWSIGWVVLSLAAALVVWAIQGSEQAVLYTTVYLIERSLSLDNLFVFILLFSYFGVPYVYRGRLLFWGIVAALGLRAVFILFGITLIEQFHFVVYLLGAALLVLAYRIFKGVGENVDPDRNLMVRLVRRVYPVTDHDEHGRWFIKRDGKRCATPLFLCLAAIVFADIAFAIDSIPAAFAITRDSFLIWMGNVFALLGLRSLFVLVEGLIERFRYLDETIAVVLGVVGVKLLTEDLVEIGPVASLAMIAVLFAVGIAASLIADRRDPDAQRKREQRSVRDGVGGGGDGRDDGGDGTEAGEPARGAAAGGHGDGDGGHEGRPGDREPAAPPARTGSES
jgi:tellurite resistance protein TerC